MAILYLPKLKIPSMAWIGGISYSIYLLHVPFGGRVMNLLERFPNFPGIKLFSIPVAIGVSILVAAVFYKFIEKPSHQFARYIKQKSLTDI
jgi:peptidoglycan/LPS O-acetylase OafA/YrhL